MSQSHDNCSMRDNRRFVLLPSSQPDINFQLQARKSRLDALENDASTVDDPDLDNPDDEEFVLEELGPEDDTKGNKKRKNSSRSRKNSRVFLGGSSRGPKTLQDWIEQDGLEEYPDYEPNYLTSVALPQKSRSMRHFCSVCGQKSNYTCIRCGSKHCSMKCSAVHNETRCLKFTA